MTRNESLAGRAIRPRGGVAMSQQCQLGYFPITPCEYLQEALCGSLRGCLTPSSSIGGQSLPSTLLLSLRIPAGFHLTGLRNFLIEISSNSIPRRKLHDHSRNMEI
ncbi:hypothetical protein ACS3SW_16185 [Roseobacteraceae bacterium S113]